MRTYRGKLERTAAGKSRYMSCVLRMPKDSGRSAVLTRVSGNSSGKWRRPVSAVKMLAHRYDACCPA